MAEVSWIIETEGKVSFTDGQVKHTRARTFWMRGGGLRLFIQRTAMAGLGGGRDGEKLPVRH